MATEDNEVFGALVNYVDENQDLMDDMSMVLDCFKNGSISHDDLVSQFYRMRASLANATEEVSERLYIK